MIDHAQAREQLELAAVEPDGLDRLMAGDTPAAASLAGHLAGCSACMDELGRLRRAAVLLRDAVATQPPAELRERTLAFVAAVGRPRGPAAVGAHRAVPAPAIPDGGEGVGPVAVTAPTAPWVVSSGAPAVERGVRVARTRPISPAWIVAAAAVLIAAIGITWGVAGMSRDAELRHQAREIAALGQLTAWQLRIEARPDARRVVLTTPVGPSVPVDDAPIGSLVFSPGSREIVVSATGLQPPGSGREYRCWVTVDGQRERLGRMYFSADLAYWVGRVDVLDRVADGSVFGISLVESGTPGVVSDPVVAGAL